MFSTSAAYGFGRPVDGHGHLVLGRCFAHPGELATGRSGSESAQWQRGIVPMSVGAAKTMATCPTWYSGFEWWFTTGWS